MKKRSMILALILALVLLTTACASPAKDTAASPAPAAEAAGGTQAPAAPETAAPAEKTPAQPETAPAAKTIVDGAGNTVEVPLNVERFAISAGPYSIVCWSVEGGNGDRIVAVQPGPYMSGLPWLAQRDPGFVSAVMNTAIDGSCAINIEEMINLDPDIVFLWDSQTDEAEKLAAVGIAPVMISSVDDVPSQIKIIGQALGKEEQAQKLIDNYDNTLSYLEQKVQALDNTERPRFLYLQNSDLSVASAQTQIAEYARLAGAVNVADEVKGSGGFGYWETVTMEQIMEWDPEVIILSNFDSFVPEDFYNNRFDGQDWSNISAVKNHRVYKEGADVIWYSLNYAEIPMFIEWMAKLIQPELFSDLDLVDVWKTYYSEMFQIEITDEDVANILCVGINGPDALQ